MFVDGLLWHGHPSKYPANLSQSWVSKIHRNIQRDRAAESELAKMGWTVVRIWDAEVRRDPQSAVRRVGNLIELRRALAGEGAGDGLG